MQAGNGVLVAGVILGLCSYAASAAPTLHGPPTQALCTAAMSTRSSACPQVLPPGAFCSPAARRTTALQVRLCRRPPEDRRADDDNSLDRDGHHDDDGDGYDARDDDGNDYSATTTTTTTVSTTVTGPHQQREPTPPFSIGLTMKLAERTQTTRCTRARCPIGGARPARSSADSPIQSCLAHVPDRHDPRRPRLRETPGQDRIRDDTESVRRTIKMTTFSPWSQSFERHRNLIRSRIRPASYHIKDKLENKLHALVCGGTMTLHAAQVGIERNWETLYKTVFGVAP